MIYLDSSVALAHLLAEDRFPAEDLWRQQLVSSRLLEYEVWNGEIIVLFPTPALGDRTQKRQRSVLDRRCVLKSQLFQLFVAWQPTTRYQSDWTSIPKGVLAQRRISRSSAVTSREALRSANAR